MDDCAPRDVRVMCGEGLRHYEVVSGEMSSGYNGYEPVEPYFAVGIYLAPNAKAARVAAVKDPEFKEWAEEQRASRQPPFKGLTVRLARCEHGECYGCDADEDGIGCQECYDESGAEMDWFPAEVGS